MLKRFDIETSDKPIVSLTPESRNALEKLREAISDGTVRFAPLDCPICGKQEFETIATRDRYGIPCRTGLCRECGLLQTNPYPDPPSLDWFYANVFAPLHRGSLAPTEARFAARRIKAAENVRWLNAHGGPRSGLAVDVGCGSGGFLQGLIDAGYRGIGVEIDADYSAWGRQRGLDIRTGTLAEAEIDEDVALVSYIQVLEHIVDLDGEIARLKSTLQPGAMVLIEVPGPTSVPGMYNHDFLRLLQLAHVWHFTPQTLTALMQKHGFECVFVNDYVRGLFRVGRADMIAGQLPKGETPEQMHRLMKRAEWRRKLYWRTWAIRAKAVLRPLLSKYVG